MNNLSQMPNIGEILEKKLIKVEVNSPAELKELGSRAAFLRIRNIDDSACYNMLCALEGAIQGVRWHGLPPEVKKDLKEYYNKLR
jgi:DNA transformation protein